ncbi:peptidylprolyl isomerase [Sphingomicrobium sediminis]|uniref:Parvulin-like PPIase n=1 Tax=Sphingomicrobium sediminis TaxID=2950949 RepID=A0A9X2EJX8_9SPHN|nr:peptidylprolyl isomerase [Sphingomicrobium sediminis]MCM8556969.1 peptidylprolyl isomerase [Sphingomicrobium sediminis]
MKSILRGAALMASAMTLAITPAVYAQDAGQVEATPIDDNPAGFRLPENIVLFGDTLPSVVKANAIVEGEIITQTDIDQRIAMQLIGTEGLSPEELAQLRTQTLDQLVVESLKIQAAREEGLEIADDEVEQALASVAQRSGLTVAELDTILSENGSSLRTIRRQIRGEIAWDRLLQVHVASFVSVGDEEVQRILNQLEANRGMVEYRVDEIFLPTSEATDMQVRETMLQIQDQLRQGASFSALARVYSQNTAAAVDGDLGWVRPDKLPLELAQALNNLDVGQISIPIPNSGGYSILQVRDRRSTLTADPLDAILSLKQVSIPFSASMPREQAEALTDQFVQAAANVSGCGGAEALAAQFDGRVLTRDDVGMREIPPALRDMLKNMQIGQATQPFGDYTDAVSVLVLCGRDNPVPGLPSADQVSSQIRDERVALRADRYLRDLRRDAVIEYR